MPVRLEVRKLLQAQQKLEQTIADIRGQPFVDTMHEATLVVERDAKILAPVDTGRLRSSITSQIRKQGRTVQGVVGSNVTYAPYQELGTGVHVGRSAYFPPPAALEVWAKRHGFPNGFVVAMAIYRAGGTKPRRFLQGAFEQNRARIVAIIGRGVDAIVRK